MSGIKASPRNIKLTHSRLTLNAAHIKIVSAAELTNMEVEVPGLTCLADTLSLGGMTLVVHRSFL